MKSIIENFRHNSIKLEFKNGNSITAIFGYGTYSDNYDMKEDKMFDAFHTFGKSTTVESMFDCSNKLNKKIERKYGEQPLNRIPIEDWLDIACKIKNEKPLSTRMLTIFNATIGILVGIIIGIPLSYLVIKILTYFENLFI